MSLTDWQGRVTPHDWHVLKGGDGPLIVLLHGAGASAGSFRGIMDCLTPQWRVFAPDLPGHDRTRIGARRRSGLAPMAADLATLIQKEGHEVHAIIGHSAGGALALQLDDLLRPRGHVLINAALAPFDGIAGWAFPGLARTLRDLPFASSVIASQFANRDSVVRLLRTNGAEPDLEMIERYSRLASTASHIAGTLAMMGDWKLQPLLNRLHDIQTPVALYAAHNDPTVPIDVSRNAAEQLGNATLTEIDGGHLVHEVNPEATAKLIESSLIKWL